MPSFSQLASSPGSLGGGDEANSDNDSIGKPSIEEILANLLQNSCFLPFEKKNIFGYCLLGASE